MNSGLGLSMSPILRSGDRPELAPLDGPPRLGWIVAILSKGRHVTHRVVKVEGERFWTRGDATTELEGPFLPREAVGRVVGFWRDEKYHRLDRRSDDLVGLASNHAQYRLRHLARSLPWLKRAIAEKDLGSPALAALFLRLLRHTIGPIHVSHETLPAPSHGEPAGGGAFVFSARGRGILLGEVVLLRVPGLADPATGYVSALSVSAPFRRLGAGRALLLALQAKARAEGIGRLGALIRRDNPASRALFSSLGYRRVPPEEIEHRQDLDPLPADMDLFEKSI